MVSNKKAVPNKKFFSILLIEIDNYNKRVIITSKNEFNDKSNLALIKCEYRLVKNVPIDQAVSQYLELNSIDFTAIIIQKEGFFEYLFSNASTSKIDIAKINKPIIVLHAHE